MLLYGIDFVLSEGIFRRMLCKLKYRKEQSSFLKLLGKFSDWFDIDFGVLRYGKRDYLPPVV